MLEPASVLVPGPCKYNVESSLPNFRMVSSGNTKNSFKPAGICASRSGLICSKVVLPKPSNLLAHPNRTLLKPAIVMAPRLIRDNQASFLPELAMLLNGNNRNLPKPVGVSASQTCITSSKVMLPKQSAILAIPREPLLKLTGVTVPKMLKYNTRSTIPKVSLVSSHGSKKILTYTCVCASRTTTTTVPESRITKPLGVFHEAIKGPIFHPIIQNIQYIVPIPVASLEAVWICPRPKPIHTAATIRLERALIISSSIQNPNRHIPVTKFSHLLLTNNSLSKAQDQPATPRAAKKVENGQGTPGLSDEDKYWKFLGLKRRSALEGYVISMEYAALDTDDNNLQSFSTVEALEEFMNFLKDIRTVDHTEARTLAGVWEAMEDYVNSADDAIDNLDYCESGTSFKEDVHDVDQTEDDSFGTTEQDMTDDDVREEGYPEPHLIFEKELDTVDHNKDQSFDTTGEDTKEYIDTTNDAIYEYNGPEPRAISETAEEDDVVNQKGSPVPHQDIKNHEIATAKSLEDEVVIKFAVNQPVHYNPCDEEEVADDGRSRSPPTGELFKQPATEGRQQNSMD